MDKYKDSMGRWLTKSLFFETSVTGTRDLVVYTLKEQEHKGYPSLKQLYLECEDITEYKFATEYLGGWKHWKALCACKWFQKEHLVDWREELEVKIRSKGIRALIDHSLTVKGQSSAKWLAEKGWSDKKRGAPSKAEKEAELRRSTSIRSEVDADLMRLVK